MSKEFKLVPASMLLDKATIGAILFHCGDGSAVDLEDCSEGLLWVGSVTDDDGKEVHGLHIATAEYPEEGSTTLIEFGAPLPPALGGEPETLAVLYNDGNPVMLTVAGKKMVDADGSALAFVELVDRAHLAPLLADNESLRLAFDNACSEGDALLRRVKDAECERDQLKARVAELEAGQPVTAKVVLPERMDLRSSDGSETYETKAWNACLDATAKLNGVTPDEQ